MTGLVEHLPALQVVFPLLVAPFILLLPPRGLAWWTATATSLLTFAIAIEIAFSVSNIGPVTYQMGSWPAPYGIELRIDSLSALLLLIVSGASTIALIGGRTSLMSAISADREHFYYAAWLLALAGLTGIVISADAFNIFVFMEIASLASYVLISGGPDRRALPAVFKYLIMGTIGATFYLIGIGLIYMMTGTMNLADMEARIHDVADQRPILVAAGFITVGLALKAAIFPLHAWLPNVYTYAPHITIVFLAACATKVALYVLLRFDFFVFQQNLTGHAFQFATYLIPLAVLGILVGSTIAMFEQNIKRMLAFSSIAQIGYVLLGAAFVTSTGLTAALMQMFNHALAKGGLFLAVAGFALVFSGSRIEEISGLARRMPWTFAAFVISGLSLIGVPGTAGFIGKWYLVSAALELGIAGLALVSVILAGSLMAVVYIWRIVEAACFQTPLETAENETTIPPAFVAAVWVVALANIFFGINPDAPLTLAQSAAVALLGHLP